MDVLSYNDFINFKKLIHFILKMLFSKTTHVLILFDEIWTFYKKQVLLFLSSYQNIFKQTNFTKLGIQNYVASNKKTSDLRTTSKTYERNTGNSYLREIATRAFVSVFLSTATTSFQLSFPYISLNNKTSARHQATYQRISSQSRIYGNGCLGDMSSVRETRSSVYPLRLKRKIFHSI